MIYAIAIFGGKQYQIKEGQELLVEKLAGDAGTSLTTDQILLLVNDEQKVIGHPLVTKAKIQAKILAQTQGSKIRVATFKAKSRYRKVKGHRQQLTKLLIEKITANF